jgi:phosphoglycerate dehydrogenase-like enzyme
MEVLFLNTLNEYWKNRIVELQTEFPDVQFVMNNNPDDRKSCLKNADAVVSGRLNEDDLANAPKLKVLFVPFTGLDNFALNKIEGKSVKVWNTHANANVVAERAIALALALLGRVTESHDKLKKGYWDMSIEDKDMWTSIQRKTCAILGLGHIGMCIAKFLKAFNCKVIGFKKHIDGTMPENVDEVTVELNDAIEKSEIIFVCLPLNEKTEGLINENALEKMEGKYLINVGRGKVIEEEALYNALKKESLKGAALDVWYNYPGKDRKEPVFPSKFPFHELPNVVLSPHKSSHTAGAIRAMIDDTIENIRSCLNM